MEICQRSVYSSKILNRIKLLYESKKKEIQIIVSIEKPRLVRLASIQTQLQSKRLITAQEIAKKHEISIRTVYRDIQTLIQSGIPIITEEGKGYRLMEGYKLPPVAFTEQEAMALITVEKLIKQNTDRSLIAEYTNAIEKIKSVLRYAQKEKTEFINDRLQIRTVKENESKSNSLIPIQTAIANFQCLLIDYQNYEKQKSTRTIEPFALYTTQNNWILIAYCRFRKEFRAFRLDRISKMNPKDENFKPHQLTLEGYIEMCKKNRKKYYTPDTPLTQPQSKLASNNKTNRSSSEHKSLFIMQNLDLKPFHFIGLSMQTTNENNQSAKDIPSLWKKAMSENIFNSIPNRVDEEIYAIYTDYEKDHTKPYTMLLGCKVDNLDSIPEGLTGRTFTGGPYVKTTATGDINKNMVAEEWFRIFDLPIQRKFDADFEVYGEKSKDLANATVEFYVGVNN